MLEFAEGILKEIRKLQADTESFVLSGAITDMERYKFMMGRLEGIKLIETLVRDQLTKRTSDDF